MINHGVMRTIPLRHHSGKMIVLYHGLYIFSNYHIIMSDHGVITPIPLQHHLGEMIMLYHGLLIFSSYLRSPAR